VRVEVIPSDKKACALYRLAWPGLEVAAQAGWQVNVHDPGDVKLVPPLSIKGIDDLDSVDLVVMQRVATPRQVALIDALQSRGIAVVVDVDDLLSDIERDNNSYAYWNATIGKTPRWALLKAACRRADLVTVSTPQLAKHYAKHQRFEVLCNHLPNHAFASPDAVHERYATHGQEVVVGWTGSLDSHPHDLEILGSSMREVMDEDPNIRFHVVGDAEPVAEALALDPARVTGTGWVPITEYHQALQDIDIALVPLQDSKFNRAKSHLKALEFAASGAFTVAKRLPEQINLMESVPVAGANGTKTFKYAVQAIAWSIRENPELMANDAREIVNSTAAWAITNQVGQWVEAWDRAVHRRRNFTD
jgi:glycosyltransferase involved in cell wall biosynthesis